MQGMVTVTASNGSTKAAQIGSLSAARRTTVMLRELIGDAKA